MDQHTKRYQKALPCGLVPLSLPSSGLAWPGLATFGRGRDPPEQRPATGAHPFHLHPKNAPRHVMSWDRVSLAEQASPWPWPHIESDGRQDRPQPAGRDVVPSC